jgi:hypothetical protein
MIKIEVTGTSIGEVADKLLAIGASLQQSNGVALFSAPHPANDGVLVPDDVSPAALKEVEVEVAEQAAKDPTPEEQTSGSELEPQTTGEPLNFELDVAPVVLRAVAAKGKPFVQDVLSEFGGARASDLDEALWPELVARLEAEMA